MPESQICDKELNILPILNTCPTGVEYLLLIGVPSLINGDNPGGYGLINWNTLKNCFVCDFFGIGSIFVRGGDFDSSNIYLNSGLSNELTVFYNGLPGYLILGIGWDYVRNIDGDVIGVQILSGNYTDEDVFIITPNPSCGSGGGGGVIIHAPIQFIVGSGGQYVPNDGDTSYDNPTLIGNNKYLIYRQAVADDLFEGIDFVFNAGGGFSLLSTSFIEGERFTLTFYA